MDPPHMPNIGPISYLVHEHARSIVAIQELRREVNSLLQFRDNVLASLPHAASTPDPPRPTKSLGDHHSGGVVDSGFSTGMGKSSSGGDLSDGSHRWGDTEEEDELWGLLDAIHKRGERLRGDLEVLERERIQSQASSDPSTPQKRTSSSQQTPHNHQWWPLSLPSPGISDFDRHQQYLRLLDLHQLYLWSPQSGSQAPIGSANGHLGSSHGLVGGPQMPLGSPQGPLGSSQGSQDMHLQFVKTNGSRSSSVPPDGPPSGGVVHSVMGGTNTVHITGDLTGPTAKPRISSRGVTVSVAEDLPKPQSRRVLLPRVLKVPIKDRQATGRTPPRSASLSVARETTRDGVGDVPLHTTRDATTPSKNTKSSSSMHILSTKETASMPAKCTKDITSLPNKNHLDVANSKGTKESTSMPTKENKESSSMYSRGVPDRQRISAILRERDVLQLQKQLLIAIMDIQLLKKKAESSGEEWMSRAQQWESECRQSRETISHLSHLNISLKNKLDCTTVEKTDACVGTSPPAVDDACVGTDQIEPMSDQQTDPTHRCHGGPNVKYDVVVHRDPPPPSPAPRRGVDKPPRRIRDVRACNLSTITHHPSTHPSTVSRTLREPLSEGRDSLGRPNRGRPSSSARSTPTATPRSSPAPSMTVGRSCQVTRSASGSGRPVARRDSFKAATSQGASSVVSTVTKTPTVNSKPAAGLTSGRGPAGGTKTTISGDTPQLKSSQSHTSNSSHLHHWSTASEVSSSSNVTASQTTFKR